MGTLVLLDLMGGVALLLWGLHKAGPCERSVPICVAFSRRHSSSASQRLMTASFAAEGVVGLVQRAFIIAAARRRGDRVRGLFCCTV